MTKMERLQWENKKMKKVLEEIYALCNMEDQEQKKYLEKFEINHPQFYPIAVGAIGCMAREGLAAVGIKEG